MLHLKKFILFALILALFSACNWFREKPKIAQKLSIHFKDDLYEQFDTAEYKPIFRDLLLNQIDELPYYNVLNAYYSRNEYMPLLVTKFFAEGEIDSLLVAVKQSNQEGFNTNIFYKQQLESTLQRLHQNHFKQIDEVYNAVANLELVAAKSLLKYHNFMQFGSINPQNFLDRFYIKVKRADSTSMDSLLNTYSIQDELKRVQPRNSNYLALKKELQKLRSQQIAEDDPKMVLIKVNMERMRWKLPFDTEELVEVNIPDFMLTWTKQQDTLVEMKVCVGTKREKDYAEKQKNYLKTKKLDDKPKNHETPQLYSVFNAIQVNPIWNIPVSIAKNEIYFQALKDPFYLSNNDINVYYKGRLVSDPDTINWAQYSREKLPFHFKQASGVRNALGKFKFVFDNSASIYLHDTNNKTAFSYANRAISHGCVRVDDPLKFAELLVGNASQYDKLRMEVDLPPLDTTKNDLFKKVMAKKTDTVNLFKLKPTWFGTRKKIGVFIAYYTAWVDAKGQLQTRPDVYAYDPIVWQAIKKFML